MSNTNAPIYIYLDQNKWIELAKGLKNKESSYENLYEKMRSNVASNIWAFPLSLIHITETTKRKDKDSRTNLLNLMYSLSKGCSISDYITANITEFNYLINYGKVDYKKIQPKMITYDLSKIIGLSANDAIIESTEKKIPEKQIKYIKDLIIEHSCDKVVFDLICKCCSSTNDSLNYDEDFFYGCFITAREKYELWIETIKKSDKYKEKYVYPSYLIKTFFEEYKPLIHNLSTSQQIKLKSIFENNTQNKENCMNLLESLPGFNIHNRLVFELLSNPYKKVHRHDFFDLAFLRVAIPYCDIVIGEKYWIDRIQHYKLDQKFGTISSTNLLELEKQ